MGNGRGSNAVVISQKWSGPSKKKRSGSVGAERPTDLVTSTEFSNLLMKVAPDSQSLCVSTLGEGAPLITFNLEVTEDFSLRASNNFVRHQ